jgi:hypothetical protein
VTVVDAHAVTAIDLGHRAEAPDGLLYEPLKSLWKVWVERGCIDALRDLIDDRRTATQSVAGWTVSMIGS